MDNIIAIATYGSQRVKPPFSKTRVSAYKIGYTNAGRAVLLALLKDQARVVSPLQARYHYIQIDVDVTVRHGYLLLNVTDDELAHGMSSQPATIPNITYHQIAVARPSILTRYGLVQLGATKNLLRLTGSPPNRITVGGGYRVTPIHTVKH